MCKVVVYVPHHPFLNSLLWRSVKSILKRPISGILPRWRWVQMGFFGTEAKLMSWTHLLALALWPVCLLLRDVRCLRMLHLSGSNAASHIVDLTRYFPNVNVEHRWRSLCLSLRMVPNFCDHNLSKTLPQHQLRVRLALRKLRHLLKS